MYTDPDMVLQYTRERQARLRQEAEADRLAAEQFRQRCKPLLLRLSNVLVYAGLWLRARTEREAGAEVVPAGRWRAMPLVMMKLAGAQTTAASLQWWPVYTLGLGSVTRANGYAIVPAAWLPCADAS